MTQLDVFPYSLDHVISQLNMLESSIKNIGLQLPNEHLCFSFDLIKTFQTKSSNKKYFVLADTSYGSCCADEVAAEHIRADLIIHFGRSCLSIPSNHLVWLVFENFTFDKESFLRILYEKILSSNDMIKQIEKVLIICDTLYWNCFSSMVTDGLFIRETHRIKIATIPTILDPHSITINGTNSYLGRSIDDFDKDSSDYILLFIGRADSPTLSNLILTERKRTILRFDPIENSLSTDLSNNKLFLKRLHYIERVSHSKCFGIVVGTFNVHNYVDVIDGIKRTLKHHKKSYYTFVIGQLNAAKLGNFLHIDMFVSIGCLENEILYNEALTRTFHRPIISPLEMILGLEENPFGHPYSVSFEEFLKVSSCIKTTIENDDTTNQDDNDGIFDDQKSFLSSSLVCSKSADFVSINLKNTSTASSYLSSRKYQGLEYEANGINDGYKSGNLGRSGKMEDLKEEKFPKIITGRKGIASKYDTE